MTRISTHVLDTALGRAAEGVRVALDTLDDGSWAHLGTGLTDADGRIDDFGAGSAPAGRYRLTFDTARYFDGSGQAAFFFEVVIAFEVEAGREHTHVPLLVSPYGFSSYRGT